MKKRMKEELLSLQKKTIKETKTPSSIMIF